MYSDLRGMFTLSGRGTDDAPDQAGIGVRVGEQAGSLGESEHRLGEGAHPGVLP